MVVAITPEIRALAQRYNEIALRSHGTTVNYTGIRNPDRYLVGYLGELTVRAVFVQEKIKFDYEEPNEQGIPDGGDFIVYHRGRLCAVDIKTASEPFHRYLMIPEATVQKYSRAAYIAAKLDRESCEIMGYVARKDVPGMELSDRFHRDGTLTRFKKFCDLKPVADLLALLDRQGAAPWSAPWNACQEEFALGW